MHFDQIAEFILGPIAPPDSARDFAATLLLDTLGVGIGAVDLAPARIARAHVLRFHAAASPGDSATLLFDGRRASIPGAAFALATQIDNLDGHDGYNPTKGHIGCAVVPALFAFAEHLPELTAQAALDAMIVAYEVSARAAIALHASVSDYHTSGAWNALGVAALGARLMGLGKEELRHALGIAEYHGPRSQMMREIANPSMLHDGSGMGALVGSMAALMAAEGFTGAPAITCEGAAAAPHWHDLGALWTVELNYIKPYPICRWAHGALAALERILAQSPVQPDDVARIDVRTFAQSAALFRGLPKTTSQAQYALPFPLAALLVHGVLGPRQVAQGIAGQGLEDPHIATLLPRIEVHEEPRHSTRFPAGRWSDVTITLRDGSVLTSGDCNAYGGPEAPLELVDVEEKFHRFAAAMPGARRDEIWAMRSRLVQEKELRFEAFAALCRGVVES